MRKPAIAPREALFWLAIVAAGGALVLAVMRPGRTSTENPALALREDGEARAAQRSAASPFGVLRHVWQHPDGLEVEKSLPKSGFEMPFAPDATTTDNAAAVPSVAASLCAALRDALSNGRGTGLVAIRARLLALGANAVPDLSGLLQCGTDRLEVEAVRVLVQIGNSEGLSAALGKVLTVPRESPAYGLFLAAFADNHSPSVAQWLTDTLGKAQYADTRERMLDLLYAMRGPAVVAALEQAALDPADEMHARDAVDALATRQDTTETESLAALLGSEDAAIIEAAAYGLASIGSEEACQILADESEYTAVCAVALSSVSSSYAQETLLALATDSRKPVNVRTSAILSLSRQPGYRVHTILANAAIQEQSPVVISAMRNALSTTANIDATQNNATHEAKPAGELWF
jgi:hypothetical protein